MKISTKEYDEDNFGDIYSMRYKFKEILSKQNTRDGKRLGQAPHG